MQMPWVHMPYLQEGLPASLPREPQPTEGETHLRGSR